MKRPRYAKSKEAWGRSVEADERREGVVGADVDLEGVVELAGSERRAVKRGLIKRCDSCIIFFDCSIRSIV